MVVSACAADLPIVTANVANVCLVRGPTRSVVSVVTVHSAKISGSSVSSQKVAGPYTLVLKRVLDIAIVLVALPFLLPFLLITGLLISLDGHSPLFLQERVGMHGKRFKMWKFRTMVPDAEAYLAAYLAENPDARAEWESKQKLAKDPRCTRIGRVLRRTSMDELPQLINVLFGDMSLVGAAPDDAVPASIVPRSSLLPLAPWCDWKLAGFGAKPSELCGSCQL